MGRGCGWLVFHGDDIPSELADKAVDVTNLVEYDFIVLLPKRNHTAFLEARWKRAPLLHSVGNSTKLSFVSFSPLGRVCLVQTSTTRINSAYRNFDAT